MPSPKDNAVPGSLADLLLSGRSARKSAEPESVPAAVTPTGQLDLLFSKAEVVEPKQVPEEPKPITQSPQPTAPAPPIVVREAERKIWSIRELVAGVRRRLEREYDNVWVEGEISNCRPATSGHIYLTLKDGDAQLAVVLFRAQASLLRFRPQDGLAVLVRGRISVY